ncbi:MAG: hypothetical protein ACOC1X_00915 [Promethearchaeota archaeon]
MYGSFLGVATTIIIALLKTTFSAGSETRRISIHKEKIDDLRDELDKIDNYYVDKRVCKVKYGQIRESIERLEKKIDNVEEKTDRLDVVEGKIDAIIDSNGVEYKRD